MDNFNTAGIGAGDTGKITGDGSGYTVVYVNDSQRIVRPNNLVRLQVIGHYDIRDEQQLPPLSSCFEYVQNLSKK